MAVWLGLFCVVLLESITGVLCYDYGAGGLVAASSAAFVLLAVIILMLVMLVLWRDWYMRRQALHGRYRIPRKKYHFFRQKSHSVISMPKSQRKMQMHNIRGSSLDSRVVVLPAAQESNTDRWITQLPGSNRYEEKSKSLKFEREEEEAQIIADILPGNTHSANWRQAPQPGTILISSTQSADTGAAHGMYQTTQQDSNVYSVPFTVDNEPTTLLRQTRTESPESAGPRPYHVQIKQVPWNTQLTQSERPAQQLSQSVRPAHQVAQTSSNMQYLSRTTRPSSGREDITLAPITQSTNYDNLGPGAVIFDSDDDVGHVEQAKRQGEDTVLF